MSEISSERMREISALGEVAKVEVLPDGRKQITVIEKKPKRNLLTFGYTSFFIMFLITMVFSIPLVVFYGIKIPILPALVVSVLGQAVTVFLMLSGSGKLSEWKDFLRLKHFSAKNLLKGVGFGVAIYALFQSVVFVLSKLGVSLQSSDTAVSILSSNGISAYIVMFVAVPFIVPFVEELFFRSATVACFEQGTKNPVTGKVLAVIFSTLYFGLAHTQGFSTFTDFFTIAFTGVIGGLNALMLMRYDSIWVPFASHSTYNGINVIMALALGGI